MDELESLKALAGVGTGCSAGMDTTGAMTPSEKAQAMRERNIRPGTQEWFRLWFSRPYLTGEKPLSDK